MIDINCLIESDKGRWVKYTPKHPKAVPEIGRVKSWNKYYVFVVYLCGGHWDCYQDYTAAATNPGHLEFIPIPPEGERP
jgi:hypothetical protein